MQALHANVRKWSPKRVQGYRWMCLGHGLCNWQANVVAASGALMFSVKYECMSVCFGIV